RDGADRLPRCRGRHPHLSFFQPGGCTCEERMLVVGASNQWFPQTLSALAVPRTGASELQAKVEQHWPTLQHSTNPEMVLFALNVDAPGFRELHRWSHEEIWAAIERHRREAASPQPPAGDGRPDLLTAEWEIFSAAQLPDPTDDFALRRDPDGVPEDLLRAWQARVDGSPALEAHRGAYARHRRNRYSDRITGPFDEMRLWPGARYLALHTLSHLLIRTIALECGYSQASLAERI